MKKKYYKVRNIIHTNNQYIRSLIIILLTRGKSIQLVTCLANKGKMVSNRIRKLSKKTCEISFKINNLLVHDLKK